MGDSGINLTDIRSFRSTYGLPANNPLVILVPGSADPGINDDEIEADLDIEWAGAVARKATIIYVYSEDVFESTLFAIDVNLAPIITLSFGGCETDLTPLDAVEVQDFAQQANAQGITWLASSGDSGAASCDPQGDTGTLKGRPGAGQLRRAFPKSRQWAERSSMRGRRVLSATPGHFRLRPFLYSGDRLERVGYRWLACERRRLQQIIHAALVANGPGVPSGQGRAVPDVSLVSGAAEGYRVISEGVTFLVGGTPAAAPTFAGMLALVNQYQVANGAQTQAGQGNINPNLYSLAQSATGVFHDITTGNNIVPCGTGTPDCPTAGTFGYSAGPGYDPGHRPRHRGCVQPGAQPCDAMEHARDLQPDPPAAPSREAGVSHSRSTDRASILAPLCSGAEPRCPRLS